jgi:hypothetical protein
MGPTITPMPQIAIAEPRRAGGVICSMTACDKGTRAAPNRPCSSRAATISTSEPETPHHSDASVKPATETRKTRF